MPLGSETASDRVLILLTWYLAVVGEYDVGAGAAAVVILACLLILCGGYRD